MSEFLRNEFTALHGAVQQLPGGESGEPAAPGPLAKGHDDSLRERQLRWAELSPYVDQLSGQRVLVVGGDVAHDAAAFAARGAGYVAACDPRGASDSAASNGRAADIHNLAWDELERARPESFDLVHCNELLHRVLEPIALLQTLRRLTVPDGSLLILAMMLADPERSEYLRFIPQAHAGDSTWWFIPGRLAIRWLLQTAGWDVTEELSLWEGPRGRFPVVRAYIRAVPREPSVAGA